MEPKIESKPAFIVVGMKLRGAFKEGEIPQLWQQYNQRWHEIKHIVDPEIGFGIEDNFDSNTGEFDYMAGMEVSQVEDLPDGMGVWEIPAQTYAVFPCTLQTLMETYQLAYQTWLPNSNYQRSLGPEFEYYNEQFKSDQPDSPMYIYIPIKER